MYRDDVSRAHDMPPGLAARLNPVDYVRLNVDDSHLVSTQVAAYWDQSGGIEHGNTGPGRRRADLR
jgi:hypothetical protein